MKKETLLRKGRVSGALTLSAAALSLGINSAANTPLPDSGKTIVGGKTVELAIGNKELVKRFLHQVDTKMQTMFSDHGVDKGQAIQALNTFTYSQIEHAPDVELKGDLATAFLKMYGMTLWSHGVKIQLLRDIDWFSTHKDKEFITEFLLENMPPAEIYKAPTSTLNSLFSNLHDDSLLEKVFDKAINDTEDPKKASEILLSLYKFNRYAWTEGMLEKLAEKHPDVYVRTYAGFRLDKGAFRIFKSILGSALQKIQDATFLIDYLNEDPKWTEEERGFLKVNIPKNLDILIALTAENRHPRILNLASNEGSLFDSIRPLFVGEARDKIIAMGKLPQPDNIFWDTLKSTFASHPYATTEVVDRKMQMMRDLSDKYGGVNPLELSQNMAMVAKRLYEIYSTMPDKEFMKHKFKHFDTALSEIPELQESYSEYPILAPHTLVATHRELRTDGTSRFAPQPFIDDMREAFYRANPKAHKGDYKHIIPMSKGSDGKYIEPIQEQLVAAKEDILKSIKTMGKGSSNPSMSVVLRGHGSQGTFGGMFLPEVSAFYLSDGQVKGSQVGEGNDPLVKETQESVKITAAEILTAFMHRYNDNQDIKQWAFKHPDVLVLTSCFQFGMANYINERLVSLGFPTIIVITGAGNGQYGLTNYNVKTGSRFIDGAIIQKSAKRPTIGGAIGFDRNSKTQPSSATDSNLTITVPNKKNKPVQISGLSLAYDNTVV